MIFSQDRDTLRRMYRDAWSKAVSGQPLTPLEDQIVTVVRQHPEYHEAVETGDLAADFLPEGGSSNPFLHMGMHLAIREQVGTDRPRGVARLFRRLASSLGDELAAEHRMMEALGETLWEAQRDGGAPDEAAYLERVRRRL